MGATARHSAAQQVILPGVERSRTPLDQQDHPRGPEVREVQRAPAAARGSGCAPTSPLRPGTRSSATSSWPPRRPSRRPDGRRPGAGRGPPRRHRPGAPRAVHRQLAGERQEPRHHDALADYALSESTRAPAIWNWRTLDIHRVLERWSPAFPRERVHVLPLPGREAPKRLIWDRFAGLVGIDPDSVDLSHSFPNASMGVVETETLRRINAHLGAFQSGDQPRHLHPHLPGRRATRPARGEPFWPAEDRISETASAGGPRSTTSPAQGFDVIGDLDSLLVPDEIPHAATPASRSPTARSPRWRWSCGPDAATTCATCGTSDEAARELAEIGASTRAKPGGPGPARRARAEVPGAAPRAGAGRLGGLGT